MYFKLFDIIFIHSAAEFALTPIRVEREAAGVLAGYVDCFICTPKTKRPYKTRRLGDDSWQLTNLCKHFDAHFGATGQPRQKRVKLSEVASELNGSMDDDPLGEVGDSSINELREDRASPNSSFSIEKLLETDQDTERTIQMTLDIEPALDLPDDEPPYEDADKADNGDTLHSTSGDQDSCDDQDSTTEASEPVCE